MVVSVLGAKEVDNFFAKYFKKHIHFIISGLEMSRENDEEFSIQTAILTMDWSKA